MPPSEIIDRIELRNRKLAQFWTRHSAVANALERRLHHFGINFRAPQPFSPRGLNEVHTLRVSLDRQLCSYWS